jgi:sec-independent protein translocase protein TatA
MSEADHRGPADVHPGQTRDFIMFNTLAIGMPVGAEWLVIAALGLLIFGKRLPEVGRSLGKGIVEFKRGLKGVQDEVSQVDDNIDHEETKKLPDPHAEASKPKFDPYTGKPIEEPAAEEKPKPKFDPYTGKPVEEAAATTTEEKH